jgi:uncharacterized integral membrane protein
MAGVRSALAAVVIIQTHGPASIQMAEATSSVPPSITRMIAVISGCLFGLLITFLFHDVFRLSKAVLADERQAESSKPKTSRNEVD